MSFALLFGYLLLYVLKENQIREKISKNYSRRFKDTNLFENIFERILLEINKYGFIDDENIFIDGTHIKANANTHKYKNEVVKESVNVYEAAL